jgi:hypothetical protein
MTNPTSNYAWQTPTPTDLVTDLPADFEVFGQAVDTSLWNSGFGQAGKNKFINGNFAINQRSFTSVTTNSVYTFDRWVTGMSGSSVTYTPQTFTPGAAPVAGYESTNFLRIVTASQSVAGDYASIVQRIEDVRTFAGQTVTVSFWAKAATGTPLIGVGGYQGFGSGGSSAAVLTSPVTQAITTSWARYSFNVTIPSITGKTVGSGSFLQMFLFVSAGATLSGLGYPAVGLQNGTFDIWGLQAEYGSKATPFQTASGGSLQGELAMCLRYLPAIAASNGEIYTGQAYSTTAALIPVVFPVTARVAPTGITVNSAGNFRLRSAVATKLTTTAINFSTGTVQGSTIEGIVAAGLVAGNATNLFNESSGTILFTGCEL